MIIIGQLFSKANSRQLVINKKTGKPMFIKNANECLDAIYEDVKVLSDRFKNKK